MSHPTVYYAQPSAAAPPPTATAAYHQPPPTTQAPPTLRQPTSMPAPAPAPAPLMYMQPPPPSAAVAAAAAAAAAAGAKRTYADANGTGGYAGGYAAAVAAQQAYDASKRQHMDPSAAAAPPQLAAAAGAWPQQAMSQAVPRESIYRMVLDIVDTALIIGRGGNTVRQIEQATGGRVKRLQEPPNAREQVVVVWGSTRELPSPGRAGRNAAQEALIECIRKIVFQESAPMGQPTTLRLLINRTQEQGVVDNMSSIVSENPGTSIAFKHQHELPACALDNDVMVELSGEKYSLMAAVETLSHVLREHPILERPGGAPAALRALASPAVTTAGGYGTAASPAAAGAGGGYAGTAEGYAAAAAAYAAAAGAGYRGY